MTSEHASPRPVNPITFLASTSTPAFRLSPAAPSCKNRIAMPVSPTAADSRRYGSQCPAARSCSPNGLCAVTAITVAAPASMIIGTCCAYGPELNVQCQCSAACSTAPHAASAMTPAGTRRVRRCSQVSRTPPGSRRAVPAGAAGGGFNTGAAVTGVAPA